MESASLRTRIWPVSPASLHIDVRPRQVSRKRDRACFDLIDDRVCPGDQVFRRHLGDLDADLGRPREADQVHLRVADDRVPHLAAAADMLVLQAEEAKRAQPADVSFADDVESAVALERRSGGWSRCRTSGASRSR